MFSTYAAGLFFQHLQFDRIEEWLLSSLNLFNTPDHQQYVGRIPDLEFYDPEGMMAKKKDELTRWHADQVRRNVPFDFQREMIDYCKSDVALLKAGCEAFQQEFERRLASIPWPNV